MLVRRHTFEKKFTQIAIDCCKWETNPKLKANLQRLIMLLPNQDEKSWFIYFRNQVLEKDCPLAKLHIVAYMEENSVRCARRVKTKFGSIAVDNTLEYFLQEARMIVCESKFWQKYDPDAGTPPLAYAYKKLEASLREKLFPNRRSEYGLLLWATDRHLKNALIENGFREPQLSQYLRVRAVVKEIGVPKVNNVIQEPSQELFIQIFQFCQSSGIEVYSPKQVKEILQHCIKALRSKRKIYEDIEQITEEWEFSPEYAEIFSDIMRNLIADSFTDKLLILRYGLVGISQSSVGAIFDMTQSRVSRRIDKIKEELEIGLRKRLINWSKENLQKNPDAELDYVFLDEKLMDHLLASYYRQQVIHEELRNILLSQPSLSQGMPILSAYFSKSLQEDSQNLLDCKLPKAILKQKIKAANKKLAQYITKIASQLGITEYELTTRIDNLMAETTLYLSRWLIHKYNLSLDFVSEIKELLELTTYIFLFNVQYAPLTFRNILSGKSFSLLWMPFGELITTLNMSLPMSTKIRYQNSPDYWGRKIDLRINLISYSFGLLVGLKEEEKNQYLVQVRIYPCNGQEYLPNNLGLFMLETNGNVFESTKSREADNWIQVGFVGRLKEEFQIKIQLDEVSIIENFVI